MTSLPTDEPDIEGDRQADAMKDQLRKDVASWSASRAGETPDAVVRPPARQAPPPAPRAARQKTKPAEAAATPTVVEKKPFKMSYDGTTDKDYIAQRIKLGAR
jgi:hypothetical protein